MDVPGGGRSDSSVVRVIGAIVAVIAVLGYLVSGWSWGSGDAIPTGVGAVVAAAVIGWSLYRSELFILNR